MTRKQRFLAIALGLCLAALSVTLMFLLGMREGWWGHPGSRGAPIPALPGFQDNPDQYYLVRGRVVFPRPVAQDQLFDVYIRSGFTPLYRCKDSEITGTVRETNTTFTFPLDITREGVYCLTLFVPSKTNAPGTLSLTFRSKGFRSMTADSLPLGPEGVLTVPDITMVPEEGAR